VMQQWRLL